MKKIYILILGLILLCSCATQNYNLSKTVWYNLSPAENNGVKGNVVTSLCFISGNAVDIYSSVLVDTTLVVKPFKYATGAYSITGNPKEQAKISIEAVTLQKETVKYNGVFHKAEAMVLISQDSISKVYGKLPKTTLP
jgi:asparagine N-glycosylation enzyme membrane subunit Stt3